jgi:hypothetical protein
MVCPEVIDIDTNYFWSMYSGVDWERYNWSLDILLMAGVRNRTCGL